MNNDQKIQALIDTARDVINNWEKGDLAAAVRELEHALNDLGHTKDASTDTRSDAEQLLERVQNAQDAYWSALSELEAETGLDLDSTRDYSGLSVDDLNEEDEESV